jgi:hypothetical protein
MKQDTVKIGEVNVPVILDRGEKWFPVTFITTKILLRSNKMTLINKGNINIFGNKLRNFTIEFNQNNVQETKCINEFNLVESLRNTQVGRLTVDQRMSQNNLHRYLGIELLPVDEQDTAYYNTDWLEELDVYTREIVKLEIKNENVEWNRMCSNCNKHFPLTNRFFAIDKRADKGFVKVCRVCNKANDYFTHPDNYKNMLIKQDEDLFDALNNDYLPKIFEAYRKGIIKRLPDCYENRESYEKIIIHLFKDGEITKDNLTSTYLIKQCGLKGLNKYLTIYQVYSLLYGEDFYLYSWKYPKFSFRVIKLTKEISFQIVNNYIKENNIVIENIFTYDYEKLIKRCNLSNIALYDLLGFIVEYYEFKYAGYLFKINAVNYYKKEDHLLFDLKYLVEEDMKLEIDKIPLYLTKYTLQKKSASLYNFIITKKNGSLYEWFDKVYPNRFTLYDFELNGYRNKFDSDAEMYIHELLNENFNNVIYNQRNSDRTLKLDGMIPDWFIMTENGVWIVEYFGLYEERQYGKSSRVTDYIDKAKRKIEKYKEMSDYKFIFLYPKDIDDNFKGTREVIHKMKENPYISML